MGGGGACMYGGVGWVYVVGVVFSFTSALFPPERAIYANSACRRRHRRRSRATPSNRDGEAGYTSCSSPSQSPSPSYPFSLRARRNHLLETLRRRPKIPSSGHVPQIDAPAARAPPTAVLLPPLIPFQDVAARALRAHIDRANAPHRATPRGVSPCVRACRRGRRAAGEPC